VSRGASVWTRTGRLEASLQQVALRREVAVQDAELREAVTRVAAETGVDPADLLAEAQALVERAAAAGARTQAEVHAFALGELGMTEEELRAEVTRRGGGR
jgi:division protein CdvB (Snf7/Vps24/ESCRT-III family)